MAAANPEPPFLAIVGPTASGKSEAAVGVAERLGAEIVSVDSTTVYRGMDIGTAKPSAELCTRVAHHLLDVAEPSEAFTVARYQELVHEAVEGIRSRARGVLLVGGSGLYFRAVVDDLAFPPTDREVREALEREAELVGARGLHERLAAADPEAAGKIEPDNVRRTVRALEVVELTGQPFSSFADAWERYEEGGVLAAGISVPRPVLVERIERRVREQVAHGLVEEVRALVERGLAGWLTSSQAIGYAEVARHLQGELGLEDAIALTIKRTKGLARRQLAWFRRDPRIRWFEAGQAGAAALVNDLTEYLRG
jgi:tRNA dimethylallyltransferase